MVADQAKGDKATAITNAVARANLHSMGQSSAEIIIAPPFITRNSKHLTS